MYFTSLPSNALSPLAVVLLRPLYVLAFLEAFISQASTITAIAAISKKEMTRTRAIVFFSLTTIGIVVAAVVLALQIQDAWDIIVERKATITGFVLFLFAGGVQVFAVSARHLVPSPWKLPEDIQPFNTKHGQANVSPASYASILETEFEYSRNSGPLAELFKSDEKQWLLAPDVDYQAFFRQAAFHNNQYLKNAESERFQEASRFQSFLSK
ncbi:MAG: hypothetical protein L6R39_000394 [Caloplaca ligustica]|nr:MAG: hypothetical protein L6R39_000394 [Caloplaca ligustica]